MPPHDPETRRAFLLQLARGASFVAPLILTVDVAPLLAQGGGGSGGKTSSSGGSTVGSLSPTAAPVSQSFTTNLQESPTATPAPWDASGPVQPPPWARKPPGSSGR